jgi:hypothetical protein
MKNRNIQFKATTLRYKKTGLLLACLAAVFISAPNPASARDQVPFNATLSGYVETSEFLPPCRDLGEFIAGRAPAPAPAKLHWHTYVR